MASSMPFTWLDKTNRRYQQNRGYPVSRDIPYFVGSAASSCVAPGYLDQHGWRVAADVESTPRELVGGDGLFV